MAALSLIFDIIGRDNASRAFNDVGESAERGGSKLAKLGKVGAVVGAGLGVAAVAGVSSLVGALKDGAAEFSDNQTAAAQFAATLKSTGGAANISTASVQALADSIEAKTGTDGAAVVSGAALLATFTKVRNEAGKGNDVFARATQAGVDLAAKGFGSVESNAVLLGKALNDPIKGLSALGKQGITFTAAQKETIKSLVKTGDTLGAQKIILAEIEGQVAGSAVAYGQTLPGQLARASAAFDGVKETIFKALLPAVVALLNFVNTRVLPGFSSLVGLIQSRIVPAFAALRARLSGGGGVQSALGSVINFMRNTGLPALRAFGAFIVGTVVPAVQRLAGGALGGLRSAFTQVQAAIQRNRPQLLALLSAFSGLVSFVVGRVVPLFGPILRTAFASIGRSAAVTISAVGRIVSVFQRVASVVQSAIAAFQRLAGAIRNLPKPNLGAIGSVLGKIPGFAKGGTLGKGVSLVGERGPELLVSRRGGERVISNTDSQRLLGGATVEQHVTIYGTNTIVADALAQNRRELAFALSTGV